MAFRKGVFRLISLEKKEKIPNERGKNDRTTGKQLFGGRCKNNYFIDNKKEGGLNTHSPLLTPTSPSGLFGLDLLLYLFSFLVLFKCFITRFKFGSNVIRQ